MSLHQLALERDVRRGLLAAGRLSEVLLLAYGWDCIPERGVFGTYGNLAHLTRAAAHAFAVARKRSHRRQRELGEWLAQIALRYRHGDEDVKPSVTRVASGCEALLTEAEKRFLKGVRNAARAA